MACYGMLWPAMVCYGLLWTAMVCYGLLWPAMVCYGLLWYAMDCYGLLRLAMTCSDLLWPPCITRFLDHTQTTRHSRYDSSGRVISSSQRPLPNNTQQTNIHAPGGIQNHDRSRRAAVDLRLIPRGHWDRQHHK
jgi:hypothetical protein